MKFKTVLQTNPQYSELVSTVGWLNADEVYSSGDDHCVLKWNQLSGDSTLAVQLGNDVYATDLHWLPRSIGAKKQASSDVFLLTSTEGKYYLVSRAGRIEKSVDAHQGAILAGRWNHDGSALLTAGEDGQLKLWSRSGMLRSTLVSLAVPVYSAVWSPNSDAVLHSNGKLLSIKPLQPSLKAEQWKAHEGIILKVDWNAVNNTIVSGGEDCKYKVWDVFGRLLYSSSSNDYPITSVAWSTNGELFAVGSFNTLRLCDKAGWSYALEKPNSGSLFNLAWAHDGTQLAAACGSGQVLFASLIERRLEWQNFEATLAQEKVINVKDVLTDAKETLDFRDRVVKMALSHSHLVVTTPSQCYIYSTKNWNTPMIFDLKSGSVSLLMLAEKHFLIVDDTGIQLYTYEGRFISAPKYASMRPDLMSEQIVSLSNDTVVVRDKADEKAMYFFEAATGKPLVDGKPVRHVNDIVEIALNQDGPPSERQVAIIDKNRDLYIRAVRQYGAEKTVKIATMVLSMCWSDTVNMLATVAENKLSIWYHPVVAYSDRDLLAKTVATRDAGEFGKNVELLHFSSTFLTMRRGDGSLCSTSVSPYPAFLHKFQLQAKWDQALRLCRFVKEDSLWACLAAMATNAKELTVSEIAYAAINEVAKVQYINKIKDIPSAEGKSAALALLCGQLQDAEIVLVQAGLFYRAIQMHIDLFNWDRALELAVKHKTHVDTVLGFRNEYLRKCKRQETSKKFLQFAQGVEVDMEKIRMKVSMELEKEAQRSGTTAMVR